MEVRKSYLSPELGVERRVRVLGVSITANHRAETQLQHLVESFRNIASTFNKSPLAITCNTSGQLLTEAAIAMKYTGSHGDHAQDQKAKHRQACTWKHKCTAKALGEDYFCKKPEEERRILTEGAREAMIRDLRGEDTWNSLSDEEKAKKNEDLLTGIYEMLAGEAYEQLPEEKKHRVKICAWVGCGMHKEMNSTKGGNSSMQEKLAAMGARAVLLPNRDNAAVLDALGKGEDESEGEGEDEDENEEEDEDAEEEEGEVASQLQNHTGRSRLKGQVKRVVRRAKDVTKGGTAKSGDLLGSYLQNKDDKKGHRNDFRDYTIEKKKRTFTFPNTSSVRYSSCLEASAEIITDPQFYIDFIHYVRDKKGRRRFSHMESNILKALTDPITLTEHAVLALYLETVSYPFTQSVRMKEDEQKNALDLAPLYGKVRAHIQQLIENPLVVLSPDADPQKATMNGSEGWRHPAAVKAIHSRASEWPYLEVAFKAFLEGALETWERFSAEYGDDGLIAGLTEAERYLAWMPPTNDTNEGTLGAARVFSRTNPTGTWLLFNAVFKFKRNDTHGFRDAMLSNAEHGTMLRREARLLLESKREKKRRREIVEESMAEVEAKRQKFEDIETKQKARIEYLESLELETDETAIQSMKLTELKDQLEKLRRVAANLQIPLQIPPQSHMPKKQHKMGELIRVIRLYGGNTGINVNEKTSWEGVSATYKRGHTRVEAEMHDRGHNGMCVGSLDALVNDRGDTMAG